MSPIQSKPPTENAFMLQVSKVQELRGPGRHNFRSLKYWLDSEQAGNHFLAKAGGGPKSGMPDQQRPNICRARVN